MEKTYKNFQKLLKIERGAKSLYDDFFKKIKEPELLKGILHVRDEEVEHIKLAEELLEILRTRAEAGGKIIAAPRGKTDAISERKGLINLTAAVLRAKIQLISLVEELDLTNQKLKELNNLKSSFVSITAHQLKGPLTSMRWFFDLLLGGRVGKLNRKQKDYIKDIYSANQKLVALVSDLLKISQLEEGKIPGDIQRIDIRKLCKDSLKKHRAQIEGKKIGVSLRAPKISLAADSYLNLLENIIDNLISNAVKYAPKNGKIVVDVKKQDKDIIVSVADTGIGILTKDAPMIFERFFRAENAKKIDEGGTGLGLSIARESAKELGGKVWFEANKPKGTIFYFSLPTKR